MQASSVITTGLGLGLAAAFAASAADVPVVPKKLIVVDKLAAASKAKTAFVVKDAAVVKGAATDPDQIGVQFDVVYGNGSAAGAFTLPAGASVNKSPGWVVNKDTVAKYVNKTAPSGPTEAKVAVIKPGKLLKLVGKGLGDTSLDILAAGDPGVEGVRTAYCVTNGAEENCHCSTFTGCVYKAIAGGTGAKLVCKTGVGDGACEAKGAGSCDPDGTYGVTSGGPISYSCCFGLVDVSISSFTFADDGATMTGAPSGPVALTGGASTCPAGSFSNSGIVGGGCTETYSLDGSFTGTDTWSGQFSINFAGLDCDCGGLDPCVNQVFPISGMR